MNVITGETGAGKTMVVTGLGLLFGGRADAGRVRADPGRAVVEGRLRLPAGSPRCWHARLADAGAEPDDDGSAAAQPHGDGRGPVPGARRRPRACRWRCSPRWASRRAGRARPVRPAAAAAPGRAARRAGPVRRRRAREAARRGTARRTGAGGGSPTTWPTAARNARERTQEADLLRLGLDEITRVDPQPGEDEELRAEAQRLEHAEGLRAGRAVAHAGARRRRGDPAPRTPDATALLGAARRALEAQSAVDPALGELAQRLDEAATLVGDVAAELSAYLSASTPTRPGCAESTSGGPRCAALTRKYADDVDGVLAWAERRRRRGWPSWTSPTRLLEELDRGAAAAGGRGGRAGRPSCPRPAPRPPSASPTQVTVELAGLAMPHAAGRGRGAPRAGRADEPAWRSTAASVAVGPDGADEVELRLLAAPGRAVAAAAAGRLRR